MFSQFKNKHILFHKNNTLLDSTLWLHPINYSNIKHYLRSPKYYSLHKNSFFFACRCCNKATITHHQPFSVNKRTTPNVKSLSPGKHCRWADASSVRERRSASRTADQQLIRANAETRRPNHWTSIISAFIEVPKTASDVR